MKTRLLLLIACTALGAGTLRAGAQSAFGEDLCVDPAKPGCFATIADALAASHDGDRIRIGPGTFAGGFVVDASVTLKGAGSGRTTISGGAPVVTFGVQGADGEPTATLSGVTITGGDNGSASSPDPVFAVGGGVYVAGSDSGGATVTISDSVVTGNRAAPTETAPLGPPCPAGPCPFAQGEGGGIANGGNLTLDHVTVSDNQAGSEVASDADGGGISNLFFASMTIRNSTITGNVATVASANGRFADAGGIRSRFGSVLTIENSVVSGNRVEGPLAMPAGVETNVVAGGIHLGNSMTATIRNTRVEGNTVTASSAVANGAACGGGLMENEGSTLEFRDGSVSGNRVTLTVTASSPGVGDSYVCSAGMDLSGAAEIRNTRFVGNVLSATATAGAMLATGGAISVVSSDGVTVRDSRITGNSVAVSSPAGTAAGAGGGIESTGTLELRSTSVADNTVTVSGAGAAAQGSIAQGGGIFNAAVPGIDLPRQLSLIDSAVVRNTLSGPAGATLEGGGLFTDSPVTMKHARIEQNAPDQCSGC